METDKLRRFEMLLSFLYSLLDNTFLIASRTIEDYEQAILYHDRYIFKGLLYSRLTYCKKATAQLKLLRKELEILNGGKPN